MAAPFKRKRTVTGKFEVWVPNKDTKASDKDSVEVRTEKDRLIQEFLVKRGRQKCTIPT